MPKAEARSALALAPQPAAVARAPPPEAAPGRRCSSPRSAACRPPPETPAMAELSCATFTASFAPTPRRHVHDPAEQARPRVAHRDDVRLGGAGVRAERDGSRLDGDRVHPQRKRAAPDARASRRTPRSPAFQPVRRTPQRSPGGERLGRRPDGCRVLMERQRERSERGRAKREAIRAASDRCRIARAPPRRRRAMTERPHGPDLARTRGDADGHRPTAGPRSLPNPTAVAPLTTLVLRSDSPRRRSAPARERLWRPSRRATGKDPRLPPRRRGSSGREAAGGRAAAADGRPTPVLRERALRRCDDAQLSVVAARRRPRRRAGGEIAGRKGASSLAPSASHATIRKEIFRLQRPPAVRHQVRDGPGSGQASDDAAGRAARASAHTQVPSPAQSGRST